MIVVWQFRHNKQTARPVSRKNAMLDGATYQFVPFIPERIIMPELLAIIFCIAIIIGIIKWIFDFVEDEK